MHSHWMTVVSLVVLAWLTTDRSLAAEYPSYLLLRAPVERTQPPVARHQVTYQPGYGSAVRAPGYSYGWFGACPRQHWSRHFGYYRDHTEWTAR